MCVSVIGSAPVGEGATELDTATGKHIEHKMRPRHAVEALKLEPSRVSVHVVAAANAANTLLDLARANHVDLIVLGAPGPKIAARVDQCQCSARVAPVLFERSAVRSSKKGSPHRE
jgi:eukaryotic-like serine/threonine-protein kinase